MNDRSLVAYDKRSGEPVWMAATILPSYSSPMLVTLGGVRQVVIVNQESVTGYDPATGRVLWRSPVDGQNPKCTHPWSSMPIGCWCLRAMDWGARC